MRTPPRSCSGIDTCILERDYRRIREGCSKVQIPAELRIPDTRKGIKAENIPAYQVINKCGKINETALKLPWTQETTDEAQAELLQKLTKVLLWENNTLQVGTFRHGQACSVNLLMSGH